MAELSERQFDFVKELCRNKVYLVIIPSIIDNDPATAKALYKENFAIIQGVIDLGFLKEVSNEFQDVQAAHRAETGREFRAFVLSEQAIKMFTPESGAVN